MEIRKLGTTNLRVSALGLGTLMCADQTDAREAAAIVDAARDRDVNFIDTADGYSRGACEQMLGPLLAADRDHWVLASKVGNPMSNRPNESRLSRKWVVQAVEASLKRLGTDYLDICYMHRDYEDDSLEEPLRAFDDLIRAGKIRYWGLSNFRGWRIAEAVRLSGQIGMPAPAVCQPYYNLLNRQPEVEVLPACRHYGLGVVPYSPIARGVLTGKYAPGAAPAPDSRVGRGEKRVLETEWREESLAVAEQLKARAAARGASLLGYSVAWVLAHRAVSSVIAGPRTLAQWLQYFEALDLVWNLEDEAAVDSLVKPGHPSTPGFNDPRYPLESRLSPR
ncbi:MAG: aldo/keto reductase [Betaproteobacteria bacterium]